MSVVTTVGTSRGRPTFTSSKSNQRWQSFFSCQHKKASSCRQKPPSTLARNALAAWSWKPQPCGTTNETPREKEMRTTKYRNETGCLECTWPHRKTLAKEMEILLGCLQIILCGVWFVNDEQQMYIETREMIRKMDKNKFRTLSI